MGGWVGVGGWVCGWVAEMYVGVLIAILAGVHSLVRTAMLGSFGSMCCSRQYCSRGSRLLAHGYEPSLKKSESAWLAERLNGGRKWRNG